MSEENISDSSLSFLRSKEDLELELEKALAEAKAVEMQLRVLELDRILALRRRAREHRRLMDEKEQLVTTVEVGVETASRAGARESVGGALLQPTTTSLEDLAEWRKVPSKPRHGKPVQGKQSQADSRSGKRMKAEAGRKQSDKMEPGQTALPQSPKTEKVRPAVPAKRPATAKPDQEKRQTGRTDALSASPQEKPSTGYSSTSTGGVQRESAKSVDVRRWVKNLPSWSVSMLVHVILLLAMAILMMPLQWKPEPIVITGEFQSTDSTTLEEVEFESEPLEELPEVETDPLPFADMGLGSLGDLASVSDLAETGGVGPPTADSTAVDIGTLLGEDGEGLAAAGEESGAAQFFGAAAGGNRFAFVVDRSASMRDRGGYKWRAALSELMASVSRFDARQSFFVIFFAGDPYPMFGQDQPQRRPVSATKQNIAKLEAWLESAQPHEKSVRTKLEKALELVLAMKPDATFILSDGKLTSKKPEAYLRKANVVIFDPLIGETRPSVIHTISFGDKQQPVGGMLQRIAESNGGTYTHHALPQPPKAAL